MPKRPFRLFIVFITAFALLVFYQGKTPLRLPGFLYHAVNSADDFAQSVCTFFRGVGDMLGTEDRQTRKLRQENTALKLNELYFGETVRENRRLKDLLSIKDRLPGYIATARVISRGSDRWSSTVVIDKGKKDFVEKDMAVITAGGLSGKIREAYGNYSTVLLIDDRKFSAAVRLQEERIEAILTGDGEGRCVLKYMDSDIAVKEGDVLITSGLDGLFPPGLNAGFVTKVATKEDALFHDIEVTPFIATDGIEEVMVVRR